MQESPIEILRRSSHLFGANLVYVEALYDEYLEDPGSVPGEWRAFFERLPQVDGVISPDVPHSVVRNHFAQLGRSRARSAPVALPAAASDHERKQVRVLELISAYRHRGHKKADIDPLGMMDRPPTPVLDLSYHRLSEADLDTVFQLGSFHYGASEAPLREIVSALEATYCGSIGAEYMHIVDAGEQLWVQQRLESARGQPAFNDSFRHMVLERLTAAEGLEKYLHNRFPGVKRFGLEGGEALIPMLHELLQRSGSHGVVEAVIGMAHRGRLNVLVNILGKHPHELFDEFEGKNSVEKGSGDVKYHQGFSSNVMTPGGEMHVALGFNPSHLEIVSPVIEGSVRARQQRRGDDAGKLVIPVSIHGDAAFAGQGVVMETFQMSQTRAYRTGGTIHIIINNQVGFTTHRQEDARSTEYCTEVAKMVQAPIFHVNGDDPEAVLFVTQLAVDYRMQFGKDVVIDLVCYRRRGHNEAEEPAKTQPLMYQKIRKHPTTRTAYAQRLVDAGTVAAEAAEQWVVDYRTALDEGRHVSLALVQKPDSALFVDWSPYLGQDGSASADTRFDLQRLQSLAASINRMPDGFVVHRQVEKVLEDRRAMAAGAMPINWGFGEIMAYATLLDQGYPIRMTGQDCGVGTFSHRHAVHHDQKRGDSLVPMNCMTDDQAHIEIFDSLLSEEAVLAFEYGFAATAPNTLVIWEAQFGDFANGAQVVIDQFICSGEHKWGRLCGLTLLLPHGYEGAGPEHSSARLERFLQLAAERNIQVCVPTTPAQTFHMLRRQVIRPLRKPLIVMTPKSLLRHKLAVSTLEDLCNGQFEAVLTEQHEAPDEVRRVVICSGKVYYDLAQKREADGLDDVVILRIEQLYPFPEERLVELLAPYTQLSDIVWCQEEPMNQGAWYPTQHRMRRAVMAHDDRLYLRYAGREASASPAAGLMSLHVAQQEKLIHDALYA